MNCSICSIGNRDLLKDVEHLLENNNGLLTSQDKKNLIEKFPAFKNEINKITDQDCSMHWNFHQSIDRNFEIAEITDESKESKGKSLTEDISKDEATILYEVLNTQAATFRCLDRKIKKAIEKVNCTEDGMTSIIVNPVTVSMYNDITSSIRQTVKEIREMNKDVNGKEDNSFEGIKALALAITTSKKNDDNEEDLTTKEFD